MDIIYNRLNKNYKRLLKWLKKNGIEAYRIYQKDIPEYPYIIDIYKDHALVFEKGKSDVDSQLQQKHRNDIVIALNKLLSIDQNNIHIKSRKKQSGDLQYEKFNLKTVSVIIRESGAKFICNLTKYIDCGLFLDHRYLRKKILDCSENKRFLNLFSYTGSFSVMAALGGGVTVSVDISSTYQRWAQENFKLNSISLNKHSFHNENVIYFINMSIENDIEKFDIILLDPPTFSNSKKMSENFEVQKDHEEIVIKVMKLLKQNGILYFSNNKKNFKLSSNLLNIFNVIDISNKTTPLDYNKRKIHYCYEITHK